jgi:hypothetical protein
VALALALLTGTTIVAITAAFCAGYAVGTWNAGRRTSYE